MGSSGKKHRNSKPGTGLEQLIDYTELIGQVLSRLRKEKGLSQHEMADALGMKSQSGYSRLESGTSSLQAAALRKAAAALDTSPQSIIEEVEALAENLEEQGFRVTHRSDEEASDGWGNKVGWFVGGAALGGLITLLLRDKDD